ncbi:MAG: hypothetical protein FWE05_04610 [Defluviitaleaceae bacterium]|nr:hypothetical protein [Defluviitaleaceae bacterium]
MKERSKSTLFLMEQVVVIAVFAFFAAVCVKILVFSYLTTVDAVDTRMALLAAESVAESYKAFSGDLEMVEETLCGGNRRRYHDENSVVFFYDDNWIPTSEYYAYFELLLRKENPEDIVVFADIAVRRISDSNELINLRVAARRRLQ